MNTKKISLGAIVIGLFLGLHTAAEAAGTAQALTNNVGAYTLNYTFSTKDFELAIPVLTQRTTNTDTDRHGYSFTASEEGSTEAGSSYGLMLSDLPIIDGKYHVPANTEVTMQLFVLLRLDEADPRAKYGLQITNVPYWKIKNGNTEPINITTTNNYHTKEIGLNK